MCDAPARDAFCKPVLWVAPFLWCGRSVYWRYLAAGGCAVPVRAGSMACTPRIDGITIVRLRHETVLAQSASRRHPRTDRDRLEHPRPRPGRAAVLERHCPQESHRDLR